VNVGEYLGVGLARPKRPPNHDGVLGRGSEPPSHQVGGLGARCKLPNPKRGPGESPGRKRVLMDVDLELTYMVTTNFIWDTFALISKGIIVIQGAFKGFV